MIPSSLSASSSSSSSSSSATVRVDKATSDLLIGPDWTMNIDICDSINTSQWDAKDVVKAVKKRLQHKNPKVQLLALTLLETMVKNCGDHVHFQIVERNILQEMIKIVKKKTDMHVRDKILVLLDSWQEAFGGPGGRYPQYYWAYEELRRAGVVFPRRSLDSAPIFTPPVARSTLRHTQAGYGMPSNSSARLDEAMGAEMENLSLSIITSMRDVLDLLADMLQAVNPSDRASVKDEVIVDLVNRCRSNQKKLMQMLSSTGDEELLGQGLELNDSLQSVLAIHDAIASGSPLPTQVTDFNARSVAAHDSSIKPTEVKEPSQTPNANRSAPAVTSIRAQIEEEEDQEDDFAQLARRHSKTHSITSQGTSTGHSGGVTSANTSSGSVTSVNASTNAMSPTQASVAPVPSNALALADPPAPIRTTKEQDMIDLLSLTLSTVTVSPQTPHTPAASSEKIHQPPVSSTSQGYPYASQAYTGNQGQVAFNSYVVPWAQPQVHPEPQPQSPSYLQPQPQLQPQSHSQPYFQPQPQPQAHLQSQPQSQTQPQSQLQPQYHSQPFFHPQPQPQPQAQLQHQRQSQSNLQPQSHSQPYFQPQAQLQPQPQSQNQPQPQPQAQLQHQLESRPQPQPQSHSQLQHQHEPQPQPQPQPQYQSQQRAQAQPQYLQCSSGYPPPPWAPTPGYLSNRNHLSTTPNMFSIPRANASASHTSMHGARPLHNVNSFTARGGNMSPMNGEQRLSSSPRATAPAAGQKPFVPSYRLFEDLNVFGNGDGKFKMSSSKSPSLSGTSSPSMVGGRK